MAKILVIDDDDLVRLTVRQYLEDAGHTVAEADDGRPGVKKLMTDDFAVVVTDILMPEQEGLETIRAVREARPGVKVIAMSGGGRLSTSQECLTMATAIGADHVLSKPFEQRELLSLLPVEPAPAD